MIFGRACSYILTKMPWYQYLWVLVVFNKQINVMQKKSQ